MLLGHEEALCDWMDPICEDWNPVTCTCNDKGYLSKGDPGDEPFDMSTDKLSNRAVRVQTRTTKGVRGFYSGTVRGNWNAVDIDAYEKAKQAIFKQLAADPRVAFGQVDNLSKKFRPKGQQWRWTRYTKKFLPPEQAHTDYSGPFHKFKNWQGTRFYDFTFYFRVT